ncbi:YitT family protein [uncultured Clostridium sp.]|uniref:YitT family protein n=1 Tax=uncultured Clostridium sp. TaxID=59620 RepID=UPI0026142C0B|nr:YitT family protein [uncultured Clostridium sp.]
MISARQNARSIVLVILGATILAFGSYNLNFQNDVTEGGVLGLMLLLQNLFNFSPSITSIVIDFTLFFIGMKFFGKRFMMLAFLSTITFSVTYRMWSSIGFIIPSLASSMILAGILSGVGVGVGVGLVLRAGGASSGDDVVAILGEKFTKLKMNHIYYISDVIVLALSLTYLGFDKIIYSVIAAVVSGKLVSIIYKFGRKKGSKVDAHVHADKAFA